MHCINIVLRGIALPYIALHCNVLILHTNNNFSAAILSAVGVPVLNSVLPSTDFCEWLRYIWPTSDAEITAVQNFFVTKVRQLHEVINYEWLVWVKQVIHKTVGDKDAINLTYTASALCTDTRRIWHYYL